MSLLQKTKNMIERRIIKKRGPGQYSANQVLLFFIFCMFFICIFLGRTLESFSVAIKNKYFKEIFLSAVKPISDFASEYKTDTVVPGLRTLFLSVTGLEKEAGWDDFYYTAGEPDIFAELGSADDYKQALENERLFSKRLSENIVTLKHEIEVLKKERSAVEEEDALNEEITGDFEKNALSEKGVTLEQGAGYNGFEGADGIKDAETGALKPASVKPKNANPVVSSDNTAVTKSKEGLDTKTAAPSGGGVQVLSAKEKTQPVKKLSYKYTVKKPFKILMVGDSQMLSIAGGLKRLTGKVSPIKITEITVHSTGFIRGDYYNWIKKLKTVFAQNKKEPFDAVVLFLGMNDYQNFYDSNGKALVKETVKWETAYREKIKKHLDLILANTKKLYWLGMPVVRGKVYNEELSYIERVHTGVASEYKDKKLVKFSMSACAPGKGAPYTDIIQGSNGKNIKLMRDDGIHYTIVGGEYIMKSFLKLLYKEWDIEPIAALN